MVTVLFGVSLIHVYDEVLLLCHVSVSLVVSAKRDAFISLCRVVIHYVVQFYRRDMILRILHYNLQFCHYAMSLIIIIIIIIITLLISSKGFSA